MGRIFPRTPWKTKQYLVLFSFKFMYLKNILNSGSGGQKRPDKTKKTVLILKKLVEAYNFVILVIFYSLHFCIAFFIDILKNCLARLFLEKILVKLISNLHFSLLKTRHRLRAWGISVEKACPFMDFILPEPMFSRYLIFCFMQNELSSFNFYYLFY